MQPADPRAGRPGGSSQPSAVGFATLARRISGWTTNLIASGLVLVMALGLGRYVIEWWHVEPPDGRASPTARLPVSAVPNDGPEEITLQFGDAPYQIKRRSVAGDRLAAEAALLAACRQAAAEASSPETGPTAAELRLLETIGSTLPRETDNSGRRYYLPERGLPTVVVVEPADDARRESRDGQLGASLGRVVVWAIAAPAAAQAWSLYTFQPLAGTTGGPDELSGISLPTGSRRTLALRGAEGEALVGFAAAAPVDDWVGFFSAELSARGWSVDDPWHESAAVWHARYARPNRAGRETLDVQFGADQAGGRTGLLTLVRAAPP